MIVIVGSTSESGRSDQLGQLLFDLDVQPGAPEQPGPARVSAPSPQLALHRIDDLRVKVEAQVVAGREVAKPFVADADPAPAHLVYDGIHHRMRRPQAFEVLPSLVARVPAPTWRRRRCDRGGAGATSAAVVASPARCSSRRGSTRLGGLPAVGDNSSSIWSTRQRLCEVEALPELAPERPKIIDLMRLLDALGDRLQMQGVAELDDGLGEHAALERIAHIVDEGLVHLQDVDREAL